MTDIHPAVFLILLPLSATALTRFSLERARTVAVAIPKGYFRRFLLKGVVITLFVKMSVDALR